MVSIEQEKGSKTYNLINSSSRHSRQTRTKEVFQYSTDSLAQTSTTKRSKNTPYKQTKLPCSTHNAYPAADASSARRSCAKTASQWP